MKGGFDEGKTDPRLP